MVYFFRERETGNGECPVAGMTFQGAGMTFQGHSRSLQCKVSSKAVRVSHGVFHSRLKTHLFSGSFPRNLPLSLTD